MKRVGRVAYIKPVGQETVESESLHIDKDVKLVRDCFGLAHRLGHMSPVVVPPGFTREYLDRCEDPELLTDQLSRIRTSFAAVCDGSDFVVAEGTG
jgi:hypothetical protein